MAAHDGLLALFQTRPLFHRSGLSAVPAMLRISEVESSAIVTIVCQIVLVDSLAQALPGGWTPPRATQLAGYVRNIRAGPAKAGSPAFGPAVSPSSSSFWPSPSGGSSSPLRRTGRMRRSTRRLALMTRGRWSAAHSSPLVGNGSGSRCSCGVSFCAPAVS